MYDFYQNLLNYFQDSLEVTLFMNFTLAAPNESLWGSWGLLNNYYVDTPYTAKWNAVMDFMHANPCSPITSRPEAPAQEITLYPNPAHDQLRIQGLEALHEPTLLVSDLNGKVYLRTRGIEEIDISQLASGMYLLSVRDSQGQLFTRKFIKN